MPLSQAVVGNHENAVLHLLPGANESKARLANKPGSMPLTTAVMFENENIVSLLLKKGLWAIGGAAAAIPPALRFAVCVPCSAGDTRFVRLLPEVEGTERTGHWARCSQDG